MPALHLTHLTLDLVHLLLHGLSLPSHDCGGTRTHGRLRIPEPATGTGVQYRNLTQHSGPHTRTFSPCLLVSSEGPSFWFPTFCNTPPNQQSHPKAAHAVCHWECIRTYLQNISGCPRSSSSSYRNSIPSSTVTERGQSNLVTLYHL